MKSNTMTLQRGHSVLWTFPDKEEMGKKKRKDKVLKSLDFPLFEIEQPITSKEPRNAVAWNE